LAEVPYLFDPGQQIPVLSAEELRTLARASSGVFVNDYELALFLEKAEWTEAELVAESKFVAVTLGKEGSRILTEGGEEVVAAVAVETALDPTGAGDAYRAGFIAGFVRGLPLATCAKVGSTVAAYAVEWYGTQNHRFTRAELAARYEAAYQESFPI
jgi:adenosine kinase